MANYKFVSKDIGVFKLFMEPLKWVFISSNREKFGDAYELLLKCLDSDSFWDGLKASHV